MSKSFHAPNASIDNSASNSVANEGESRAGTRYRAVVDQLNNTPKFTADWFRLKEEEIHLRSHPDIEESNCTGRVYNSQVGEARQVQNLHVSEANNEKISTSDSDQRGTNKSKRRSSRGRFTFESSSSQQEAKSGAEEQEGKNLEAIATDLPIPSCVGSNANESDPPNGNKRKEGTQITKRSKFLTAHVPPNRDLETEHEQTHSNVGIVSEAAIAMDGEDHELPPVPVSLHSHTCEGGHKTKMDAFIVTLHSRNDEGPSLPFSLTLADSTITEKLSRVDAAAKMKSDQSDSSVVPSPPVAESNHSKLDQALLSPDVVRQARAVHPEVNINYGPHLSPHVIQRYDDTPTGSYDVPSQSRPNGRRHEEEGKDDVILIPEAFPVEVNAPVEVAHVGVAELVEPDQSAFPFKKPHACIALTLFAAIVIGLVATIYFTRHTSPSIGRAKTTLISTPSLQPTFLLPSTQPSLIQPSMQPSLSMKYAIEKNVLQRNATFDVLEATDARVLAFDWIIREDKKLAASEENLFQRYVLVLIAFEYSNLGWLSGVNSNGTECDWIGVACDMDEHVIRLNLDDKRLDGTIPPEIGSLQYLQMLSMSGNSLSATLPYELGNLRNMSELYLNVNNFTGPLPSEIFNLTKLTALDLSGNALTGTLPLEIRKLKKLTKLSLESNLFNGTLPSELGSLIELDTLDLRGNLFSGTLPPGLGNLNKLAEIDVSRNIFSGTLPVELGNLSNLTQLKLSYNYFMGPLPVELGNLNMLNVLRLDRNELAGTLPSEFGNLKKLTEFDLYSNRVTGTLPSQLGNLIEMTSLVISQNRFEGTIPTEIGNLKRLEAFVVNENELSGTVPSELGQLNMLWTFWIFSDKFSGTLPSELGQLTSVRYFWIYDNQFTGTLPSWIGDFTELGSLYVGGNGFVGTLPSELGLLKELIDFGVDKNEFTGTLPSWIGDFRGLSALWINNNQFTGTFPSEIENNLDLTDFCAKINYFTGPVPHDIETRYTCYE